MLFLLNLITIAFLVFAFFHIILAKNHSEVLAFLETAHQILIIYTTVDTTCSALQK